jgi:ribosomal protein S4
MKKTLSTQKQNISSLTLTEKLDFSSKLSKLNYLLGNSHSFQTKRARVNLSSPVYSFSFGEKSGELSKDLPLFLSLTEKPVDLLFSIDQFVFEFSKTTYQQRKTGEFFQQLKERKKLSLFYGHLTRKQIATLFKKAGKIKGYFSRNLFSLLERRLDVAVYRSGFAQTIAEARQLIKHNKIRVNEARINVSSYSLHSGDIISVESEKQSTLIHQILAVSKSEKPKQQSRGFEDYYSRLKNLIDGSPLQRKKVHSKKNFKSNQNLFYLFDGSPINRVLCDLVIQCLLSRLKSRSFFSIFHEFSPNQNKISSFLTNYQSLKKKKKLTVLKWKLSHRYKSSQKKTLSQKQFTKKSNDLQKNFYATGGCLEKNPLFWNQTNVSRNKKKVFFSKTSRVLKEFQSLKTKNRFLIKTCFLIFLKHLSISKKFQALVALNFKKSLYKKSADQTRFGFSQILHWRTSKPIHLETSYSLLTSIFLYAPQRINFPFYIDLDLIQRSLR